MSEFMGLIRGVYDAKADGFLPGMHCSTAGGLIPVLLLGSSERMQLWCLRLPARAAWAAL